MKTFTMRKGMLYNQKYKKEKWARYYENMLIFYAYGLGGLLVLTEIKSGEKDE